MKHEEFLDYIWETEDIEVLKKARDNIEVRIDELRKEQAVDWDKRGFKEIWAKLSDDAKELINKLAEKGGTAYKDDILKEKPEWSEMKVTGLLAGINNRSRRMGYRDLVVRTDAKKDRLWTTQYSLNEKVSEFLKE